MNILQKIFSDHFEEMIYLQHPRDSVIENVEKMIHCGNMYSINRTTSMSFKLIDVQHPLRLYYRQRTSPLFSAGPFPFKLSLFLR